MAETDKDGGNGRYVTNRELYAELTAIRSNQTRLWIAVTAVGGVNVSALLKSFGGPDIAGFLTTLAGVLF